MLSTRIQPAVGRPGKKINFNTLFCTVCLSHGDAGLTVKQHLVSFFCIQVVYLDGCVV